MRRVGAVLAAAAIVIVFAAPSAHASADDLANSIASEVASPFCPGVTLENCPSDAATALRAKILEKAEAGWSKDRIMAWLEDEYGASIRAVPPASGSGLWAWLAPALALVAGALLAAILMRKWTSRRGFAEPSRPEPSGEMRARIDDELTALRSEM